MAHKPNFNMTGYHKIWDAVRKTVQNADLSFANIEAPVYEALPYSSFPNFNMHEEYPQAAIDAGFCVFSVINNHTNDQGLEGMRATMEWATRTEERLKGSARPVYFCGLNARKDAPISYRVIQKGSWTVLFCAVTEILNRPTFKPYMNYVAATESGWNSFLSEVKKMREQSSCDLLILSIHSDEPEYVFPVEQRRRDYYHALLDCGADVVWTNHPHIPREKEFVGNRATQRLEKAIIYGNGNTISGQRWEPDFENPRNPRDDTGDGYLLEMTFAKNGAGSEPYIKAHRTHFITTYINSAWEFIIKNLDDDFISYLKQSGRSKWPEYIQKRKEITEQTKETITWQ